MSREQVIQAIDYPNNQVGDAVWTILPKGKVSDPIRVWFEGDSVALVVYYGKTGKKNPGDNVCIGGNHLKLVNEQGPP